jgi:WhiB family transcriptional regulator, redox-sensing transcriptional regulator
MSVPEVRFDQDWRSEALCSKADPELFFSPGALEHKSAKRVCRLCPVRNECLAYAMEAPVDHGIWGGLTERERRGYRRKAGAGDWRLQVAKSI